MQGATIEKGKSLILDFRNKLKPAMAYVMLSRVQEIGQLFILDSIPDNRIYPHNDAMQELKRMEEVSLNNQQNPK